jgi:hypothetical protein
LSEERLLFGKENDKGRKGEGLSLSGVNHVLEEVSMLRKMIGD